VPGPDAFAPMSPGVAAAGGPGLSAAASVGATQQQQQQHEDVPGVPQAAWLKVARGTPPMEPYSPGDVPHGFCEPCVRASVRHRGGSLFFVCRDRFPAGKAWHLHSDFAIGCKMPVP
jgi:hypothetical protein